MDMTESIAPKSDQLDAVDLISGPRTFTIEKVTKGNPDQPFNFHLEGFPRVWRPGKSMRRVIVSAWGPDATQYTGKSVTLFCDPTVEFGGAAIGGTRISHMSGIDKPIKVPLIIKRGKSAIFTVQPLKDASKPAQGSSGIPPRVIADLAKAIENGDVPAYLEYLTGQGAPPHIIAYVTDWRPDPEAVA